MELARLAISHWQKISERHFFVTILSILTGRSKGGVPFTDFIGHWASRQGYDGILFFGARAIDKNSSLRSYIDNGADDGMMGPVVHGYFHDMRKQDDLKNLVVFSGVRLTSKVVTSRLLPDLPDPNPYYGATVDALEQIVDFKAEYQAEQSEKGFYLERPFTVE